MPSNREPNFPAYQTSEAPPGEEERLADSIPVVTFKSTTSWPTPPKQWLLAVYSVLFGGSGLVEVPPRPARNNGVGRLFCALSMFPIQLFGVLTLAVGMQLRFGNERADGPMESDGVAERGAITKGRRLQPGVSRHGVFAVMKVL